MDYQKQDKVVPIALGIILLVIVVGGSLYFYLDARAENNKIKRQNQQLVEDISTLSDEFGSFVDETASLAELASNLITEQKYEDAVQTISRLRSRASRVGPALVSEPGQASHVETPYEPSESSVDVASLSTTTGATQGQADAEVVADDSVSEFTTLNDEVENLTFTFSTEMYHLAESKIELYIGEDGTSEPWLRFKIYHRYSSKLSWLFVDSFVFKIDGVRYEFTPDFQLIRRDSGGEVKWEWYDSRATEYKSLIDALVNGKSILLRCEGGTRVEDRSVTLLEKRAMSTVLQRYIALGGVW